MARRYPGRSFATTPERALDLKYRDLVGAHIAPAYPCQAPLDVHGIGLPDPVVGGKTVPVTVWARCRKCDNCLLHRQRLWTARAMDEVRASRRTWFGTLTVRPSDRFRISLLADLCGSTAQSRMTDAERFRVLADIIGKDITKMFKRLRKGGAAFRYLLVCEAHKDGFPHFHLLLHESGEPLRKARLDGAWPLGFSRWKLVDEAQQNAAIYACKYLSKSALTRVRASQKYGQAHLVGVMAEAVSRLRSSLAARVPSERMGIPREEKTPPSRGKEKGQKE